MKKRLVVAISFVSLAACTREVEPLVPTDLLVGPSGGVIRAGDCELEIPPGALPSEQRFTLATTATRLPEMVSSACIIGPHLTLAVPATLRFYVPGLIPKDHFSIATISAVRQITELTSSEHSPGQGVVSARLAILTADEYAAVDLVYDACAGRACGEGCTPCPSSDPGCVPRLATSFCDASGACVDTPAPGLCDARPPGWSAPPGTGEAFIMSNVAFASAELGFDLDGSCIGPGNCIDNEAGGNLGALVNDQLRQGLLGGETLIMMELMPAEEGQTTLTVYGARDFDEPFFPANNFKVPPGHTTCCEFLVNHGSLTGDPLHSRSRMPVTVSADGREAHTAALGELAFDLTIGVPPHPTFALHRTLVSFELGSDENGRFISGVLGGAWTIHSLVNTCNPYCRTVSPRCPVVNENSTMLDLIVEIGRSQPDVDLDGDGLEQLVDRDGDGVYDTCLDGCIGACAEPRVVEPVDPQQPSSCANAPEMADGFGLAFTFRGVPAKIMGVE